MKKFLSLLIMGMLLSVLLVGCGSDDTNSTDSTEGTEDVDTVSAASIVTEGNEVINSLTANGTWIVALLNDIEVDDEIIVDGLFYNKDDETSNIYRKLALYTQDDDHNIIDQFTLTAPKMTIKSENFKIQGGTFVGDVYVEANGFNLSTSATIDGNVYFATKEALDTFVMTDSSVITGTLSVDNVDVVSTASLTTSPEALVNALSADGTWIVAIYNNMSFSEALVVDGLFYNKDDETSDIYRKLALYTQDEDRNITASFTLSAPSLTVNSENFKIQGGTFAGDVYVNAPGFTISLGTVDGNVYFASQELMDSFVEDETGTVTGLMEVQN